MSAPAGPLPRWIDIGVVPIVNLALALIVAGLIVLAIGQSPLDAIAYMMSGAFGSLDGISYTLYYATDFIFTGLAVAVAFHAGLFNIGGEGQAYIGGLGVGIVALNFDHSLTLWPMMALGIAAAAVFGAGWAFIPAYLQAKRGSHIVITTIMFNFLAAALMNYLLVYVFRVPGSMEVVSRNFEASAGAPQLSEILATVGITVSSTPFNLSFAWAMICCVGVWLYLWKSRGGYEIRTTGLSPKAAQYAGISPSRITIVAMLISGALSGFVGLNEIMGYHRQLLLDFVAGAGFTGIAVALMGRNHPFGIVLASILFGALFQGGSELAFEMPTITRDMIVVIQGLVILFSGALAYMNRPLVERLWGLYASRRGPVVAVAAPEPQAAEAPPSPPPPAPAVSPTPQPLPAAAPPAAGTTPQPGSSRLPFLSRARRDAVPLPEFPAAPEDDDSIGNLLETPMPMPGDDPAKKTRKPRKPRDSKAKTDG
ncbi:MAG TPA: ABC transporter permease [Candidatus Cybelea sp.]|nr:ABC transporter permease [Candidatus Cybelea sp.]